LNPSQSGRTDIGPPAAGRIFARLADALVRRSGLAARIVFADGTQIGDAGAPAQFVIRFRTRRAELRALRYGHVGLLEAYFDGDVDVDGDIALVFRSALARQLSEHPNALVRLRNRWHEFRFSNRSIAQAKANARAHYGLGKAFYAPWLDRVGMMYTCAYWSEGTRTLEEAQRNKMDHVCRKIQLKAGETFVDVGCGWGGLLFHAWRNYGARGVGVNVTPEQVVELNDDLARLGLSEAIRVIECDFREIPGQYDKLLSIGTLEHAGTRPACRNRPCACERAEAGRTGRHSLHRSRGLV
jgi:cyclopropane-fatty-acyl-phospholipid synthase